MESYLVCYRELQWALCNNLSNNILPELSFSPDLISKSVLLLSFHVAGEFLLTLARM